MLFSFTSHLPPFPSLVYTNSKTSKAIDLVGFARPCTIRRTFSAVSRLKVSSPQRTHTVAGM